MKFTVIGADGQLGTDLCRVIRQADELVELTWEDVEVADIESVSAALAKAGGDVVVNTAAYHKVDECESNKELSFKVNELGAGIVAQKCAELGAACVFISTDYVYGGDAERSTPYVEDELPAPLNVYGASKAAGEAAVRQANPKHFIVRSTGLYGKVVSGKGYNFVGLMLKLAKEKPEVRVVDDQILTPTYTLDLAEKIVEVCKTQKFGTYHMTNAGHCSWFEFTKKIFELAGVKTPLHPTTSEQFKTAARRPAYSVLDNKRLRDEGFAEMRSWQEALEAYLKEVGVI